MEYLSVSAAGTKKLAGLLAKQILSEKKSPAHARVVALVGDLGAGKTTFTQGFASGLGLKERMISPTFLIHRNYRIKNGPYKEFFHCDLYRIQSVKELKAIGFPAALKDSRNLFLIEWADRFPAILPKDAIWVELRHGRKENERTLAYRR